MISPPQLLIVDDDASIRRLYRRLFDASGYRARVAESVKKAIALARDPATRPDLILCDVVMPGVDGVDLLRALHAAPETSSIPAILMTGADLPRGMMALAVKALGIGPVHLKGGPVEELLARVTAALDGRERRALGISVDGHKMKVWIGGQCLPDLPARRFQLLCALLDQSGPHGREELLAKVWAGKDNLNVVDVTIMRLRQDLKPFPFVRIDTVPAGYQLSIDESPPPREAA